MWRHKQNERQAPLQVLAVTTFAGDVSALGELAAAEGWQLETCASVSEAVVLLARIPGRVVLLDRDVSALGWRGALTALLASRESRVVLISPVTDDFLWDEVVRLGGYDVITRPLDAARTLSAVNLAVTAMRAG
ncbi:MAG TPA: hypothetical protein DEQ47_19975 [Solibacterales bacterium]|nr:hypothetical protein [Bryobacterales bacterium]